MECGKYTCITDDRVKHLSPPVQRIGLQFTMAEKIVDQTTIAPISSDVSIEDVELQGYDAVATKKLLRKLDWHLIPFMSLIYLSVSHFIIYWRSITDRIAVCAS